MLNDNKFRKDIISKREAYFNETSDKTGPTIDVKSYAFTNDKIVKYAKELIKRLKARSVMLYLPMKGETDITGITELPLSFYVPVTHGVEIMPALYSSDTVLTKGVFGVSVPENPIYADKSTIDLVLVPAVAVDRKKNRMGYGKGCYDRFLADMNCIKAAVCFDFQVVNGLKPEPHDVRMDYIITESGCI